MDVITLRTQIETALADELGEYVLVNGRRTPAICVRSQGENLAPGTVAKGLECVIMRYPRQQQIRQYANVRAFDIYTVYLVDWGSSNGTNTAVRLLTDLYPQLVLDSIVTPRNAGPQYQIRLELKFNPE